MISLRRIPEVCRVVIMVLVVTIATSVQAHSVEDSLAAALKLGSDHEFDGAIRKLEQVLREHPDHGPAWLSFASVLLVVGDKERAHTACQRASALVDVIAALACYGRIAIARQQPEPVYSRLSETLNLKAYLNRSDHYTAWAHAVAAELAVLANRPDDADRHFRKAIALGQPDQVHVAFADHLIATGRSADALPMVSVDTKNLALFLRRLTALACLGKQADISVELDVLEQRFLAAMDRGEFEHSREYAYFFLHLRKRPDLALIAAERNLTAQKEPEDHQLLAQALANTGSSQKETMKNSASAICPAA